MFENLFSTDGFITLGTSSAWTIALRSAFELSYVILSICHLLIPVGCWRWYRLIVRGLRPKHERTGVLFLCTTIFLCGVTHLMNRQMFEWPAYRLYACVLALCVISALATLMWMFYALGGLTDVEQRNG